MSIGQVLEPGWHPDPFGRHDWRYWDGTWTNHVADAATAPAEPGGQPEEPTEPEAEAGFDGEAEAEAFPAASSVVGADFDAALAQIGWSAEPPPPPAEYFELPPPVAPVEVPERVDPDLEPALGELPSIAAKGAIAVAPPPAEDQPAKKRKRRRKDPPQQHAVPGALLPPMPRSAFAGLGARPINFGRAGLVVLAAIGLAVAAYLPWVSGMMGVVHYEQTGVESGHGWYFVAGAGVLSLTALLAARFRLFRLAPLGGGIALFATACSELIRAVDSAEALEAANSQNSGLHLGVGMFLLMGSAVLATLAALRLSSRH